MQLERTDIETQWNALIEGRSSRDAVVAWAIGMQPADPVDDIMVEIGVQQLSLVDIHVFRTGSRRGVAGEFIVPTEKIAQRLERWRADCVAFDADPDGIVYLSEDQDFDSDDVRLTHWKGTFSGSWQGAVSTTLHTPGGLNADQAIQWGLARSSRVIIRSRDDGHYSAGVENPANLPVWPDDMELAPRADRVEGMEWLDRTDDDEPISWDVSVSVNMPPLTETDEFLEQYGLALREDPGVTFVSLARTHPEVPPCAVIRVRARTEPQARQEARNLIWTPFNKAIRGLAPGQFGWTMMVQPRPTET
jgi:hypothetical protein